MKSLPISLALVFMPVVAAAQQPAADAAPPTRVNIQLATGADRKPLSFEMGDKGVPLFKVNVEGHEVWAMLDKGAGRSVIDTGFARSVGLELTPAAAPFVTPTGEVEQWTVPEVAIVVPGQMAMRAPVSAIDLSGLSALIGGPVSLIIGKEYFDNLEVVVQPVTRQIVFAPSGAVRLPETTPFLPIQGEYPQVELTIGAQSVTLGIDLGSNGQIDVGADAWTRLGLDGLPTTEGHVANAAGRASSRISAIVDGVAVGPTSLDGVEVSQSPTFAEQGDGIIGYGLLARFIFALDVKARRLRLIAPIPRAASAPAEH